MTIRKSRLANLLLLFSFSAIIIGCSSGTTSSSSSVSNTVQDNVSGFYYAFDDTGSIIVDGSGNDFHGTATAISRVTGKVGGAVEFLESGSIIELPVINDNFPFETGFSFRAWIKVDAAITDRQQIIGGSTSSSTAAAISNFGISLIDDSISLEFPLLEDKFSITTSALSFPTNTWFHIAITYDGANVNFYYNGDLVANDSFITTYSSYFQNNIGNNQRPFSSVEIEDQFIGYMDELYLENVVLTQSEVTSYYLDTM